ncbi:chromosomal replication initiator protein DnaA [Clostridia bacterium]|nr:chromosomal replication initiator protein DnaA [Clostridia bacterium]
MFNGVWKNTLEEIRTKLSPAAYSGYFNNVDMIKNEGGVVVLGVINVFVKKNLEVKYRNLVTEALKKNGVEVESFTVEMMSKPTRKAVVSREVTGGDLMAAANTKVARNFNSHPASDNGLSPRYTFENFVIGTNNDLAVGTAKAIVDSPGNKKYNPFFLYGPSGIGKTHLIQAIGNELLARDPKIKVLYTTIEQFYHGFVEAMRKKTGFSDKYRKLDVLIIDDIQFIAGKVQSQEEFFHTFNELCLHDKQVIVSSDRLPSHIATLEDRMVNRLMSGRPVDMQLPDFETRCAILKSKAEFEGAIIENEDVEFLANNIRTNIRELEGKFNNLVAMSDIRKISIHDLIDGGYLESTMNTGSRAISPKQVIDTTAKFFQIKVQELCGKPRAKYIATARHIAAYLLVEELGLSTVKAGMELGGRDHTTVMNSLKVIKEDMKLNIGTRDKINALKEKLYV